MWLLLGLASRNATRNLQRTLLTALTVVLGTALLTVALTWINGVFGQILGVASAASGHVRIVDPDFAAREELNPLYENIGCLEAVLAKVKAIPGVEAAYPRIMTGVTLTVGEEVGETFSLAVGAPEEWYQKELKLDRLLVQGKLFSSPSDIVLGISLANRVGAHVGGEIVILGQTQDGALSPVKGTVVGIVQGSNALIDQQAYLPFERIQYMADITDGATEILVYGPDRDDAADLRDALTPAFPDYAVQAWSDRDPWAGILKVAGVIQGTLTGIIIFITALGVWNTMMMSVLERTGEVGVMRAMGLGRAGAVFIFVVEAVTIAVIGGAVGVGIGAIGGAYLEAYGISLGEQLVQNASFPISSRMYGDLDGSVVTLAFFLGLVMAIVGSAPPALRAASIQPVTAMRARR